MLAEVDEALKNFGKEFPSLKGSKARMGGLRLVPRAGTICSTRMPLPSTNKTSLI